LKVTSLPERLLQLGKGQIIPDDCLIVIKGDCWYVLYSVLFYLLFYLLQDILLQSEQFLTGASLL